MNCINILPLATASRAHAIRITKIRLEKNQTKKWVLEALDRANRGAQFFERHLHTERSIKF